MKKKLLTAVIVIVLLVVLLNPGGKYNKMVTLDEGVSAAWSQVENQYQRRLDLVPNLVATVRGAADFEKETLTAVTEARAKASRTNIDVKDAQEFAEFQANQRGLSSALSRLLLVMEQYPELKATQQFSDLSVQLEGTENRIATERGRYNEVAKEYNVYVRKFPNNIWALIYSFDKANLFEATEGAEEAPVVDFGDANTEE